MSDQSKKKYRLFALLATQDNVDYAGRFRFSRVTPDYILVYDRRARVTPPDGKAIEIREEEIGRLNQADVYWLIYCGASLLTEAARTDEAEGLDRLSGMVRTLEDALEEEKRKGGGEDGPA